jgi:hypothetical protein
MKRADLQWEWAEVIRGLGNLSLIVGSNNDTSAFIAPSLTIVGWK